jgi:predicted amidohydrolase
MASDSLTVALAQISPVWLDRDATVRKVAQHMRCATYPTVPKSHHR